MLLLSLERTFDRPLFITCQSPVPTALCIRMWNWIVRSH